MLESWCSIISIKCCDTKIYPVCSVKLLIKIVHSSLVVTRGIEIKKDRPFWTIISYLLLYKLVILITFLLDITYGIDANGVWRVYDHITGCFEHNASFRTSANIEHLEWNYQNQGRRPNSCWDFLYSQLSLLDSAKITILVVFSRNMAWRTKFRIILAH